MMRVKQGVVMVMVLTLFAACTVMDDNSIPRDQFDQVEISDFEVNLARDYIRGKIQNNGKHEISSSIFKFDLYSGKLSASGGRNSHDQNSISIKKGSESIDSSFLLLSQNFVVRETLKPGYSTEFYFELKMDYDFSDYLYNYEIIHLKGR